MKLKLATYFLLMLVGLETQAKLQPYRPSAESLPHKGYELHIDSNVFNSEGYFDLDGKEQPLQGDDSFSSWNTLGTLILGYGEHIQMDFWLNFRSNSSVFISQKDGLQVDANNRGAESYGAAFKYALEKIDMGGKPLRSALRVSLWQTFYDNDLFAPNEKIPDEIVLGNEGAFYQGDLLLSWQLKPTHYLNGELGFRIPPSYLSKEVPYNLSTVWLRPVEQRTWIFGLGIEGFFSMGQDEFEQDPGAKAKIAHGASNSYNSINQTKHAPYIQIGHSWDTWRLQFKAQTLLAGSYIDKGNTFGLEFVMGSIGENKAQKNIDQFKEYNNEGQIMQVSPRQTFVKIDLGLQADVDRGARVDFYQTDYFGGNEIIASGVVYKASASWSIVKITQRYVKGMPLKEGMVARAK